MKIASADLQMASSHAALQHREARESLRTWVGQQRPDSAMLNQHSPRPTNNTVNISDAGMAAQSADDINKDLNDAVDRDPALKLIRQMLEFLTGEKIKVTDVADSEISIKQSNTATVSVSTARTSSGFGIEYNLSLIHISEPTRPY